MPKKKNQSAPKTSQVTTAAPPTASTPPSTASAPTGPAPTPPVIQAHPVAAPATSPTLLTSVANGNNTGSKLQLQTAYSALASGLLATYAPSTVFSLVGGDITCDELVVQIKQYLQAAASTAQSYQQWRTDVQTERALEAALKPRREGMKGIVEAKLGKSSPQLPMFGFAPQKVAQRSATTIAKATVKAKATRAARGTVGKKQKLAITGNVTDVTITPVTSTASEGAQAPSTPAPVAPPAKASGSAS